MTLLQQLQQQPHHYGFQSALYALETQESEAFQRLRLATYDGVTFPGSDIKSAEYGDEGLLLRLQFMGFYGVDAPLPNYFMDLTHRDNDIAQRWRDYFDQVMHGIYTLQYQAWKKYRLELAVPEVQASYQRYLRAFSQGLLNDDDTAEWAQVTHLLSGDVSSANVKSALQHYLDNTSVTIEEHQPYSFRVPSALALGLDSITLASNSLLGDAGISFAAKIRIVIGPVSEAYAQKFLPTQSAAQRLHSWIQRLLAPQLRYSLTWIVEPEREREHYRLGDVRTRLSWSTWLGVPNERVSLDVHTAAFMTL